MNQSLAPTDQSLFASFDLVAAWLSSCRTDDDASDATITAYRIGIEVWIDWLSGHRPESGHITPQDIEAFRAALKRRYGPKTVNLRLAAVKSFYRWMVTSGRLPVSPASEIKSARVPDSQMHKRDELTDAEVTRVLATCDGTPIGTRDLAIVTLMAYGGLREIEVHRASLGDLQTQAGRMTLTVSAKRRTRVVVVKQDREGVIRDWLAARSRVARLDAKAPLFVSFSRRDLGERLSTSAIRRIVKARYALAGVTGTRKTTHSLRHSAITRVIRNGGTPLQTQQFAGHSSFDTTLIYHHEVGRLQHPAEDLIEYGET